MDAVQIGLAVVAITNGAKLLLPEQVKGAATIIIAAVAGAVLFNIDYSNPWVSGALMGLNAAGVFGVLDRSAQVIRAVKQ